jgi:hypothetical protein
VIRQTFLGALVAVACTAFPCFAQEPPVVPFAREPPVVPPQPVATDNQMLHKYVWATIGFDGALSATVSSSLDQWKTSPPEWRQDARGYTRRWVSEYAESAIGDGAKYAVAHFFHQDPSFYPCACSGVGRRLHHAVDSPFMARNPDGTRVPSAAFLAGALTGQVVSASTWYPAPLGARDGLKHAAWSLASKVVVDVFKEFRPRRAPKQQPPL